MKKIKYCVYPKQENISELFKRLENKYQFELTTLEPNFVFYFPELCSQEYLKHKNVIRICWVTENIQPNFALCDYAIGNCRMEYVDRYFRYPYYMMPSLRSLYYDAVSREHIDKNKLASKDKFCNFICGNPMRDPYGTDFFKLLSKYKFVHSAGAYLNNTKQVPRGDTWMETFKIKVKYQNEFKFSLAFENSSAYGYVSEKIINAYQANTIPVYWGDPRIEDSFHPDSFINCNRYHSMEEAVEKIIELDNDDEKYLNMLNHEINVGDRKNNAEQLDYEFDSFLDHIFSEGKIWRNYSLRLHDYHEEERYIKGICRYDRQRKICNKLVRTVGSLTPERIKDLRKQWRAKDE